MRTYGDTWCHFDNWHTPKKASTLHPSTSPSPPPQSVDTLRSGTMGYDRSPPLSPPPLFRATINAVQPNHTNDLQNCSIRIPKLLLPCSDCSSGTDTGAGTGTLPSPWYQRWWLVWRLRKRIIDSSTIESRLDDSSRNMYHNTYNLDEIIT
jgi:hypothetical protein